MSFRPRWKTTEIRNVARIVQNGVEKLFGLWGQARAFCTGYCGLSRIADCRAAPFRPTIDARESAHAVRQRRMLRAGSPASNGAGQRCDSVTGQAVPHVGIAGSNRRCDPGLPKGHAAVGGPVSPLGMGLYRTPGRRRTVRRPEESQRTP